MTENGFAAFDAAIAAGHGIECDVRISRDGVPFIFHDARLGRLTADMARLSDRDAVELDALRLPDGGGIPRLSALIARGGDALPLLLELKVDGWDARPICSAVHGVLTGRPEGVGVMSFHPHVPRWFAARAPAVPHGLVYSRRYRPGSWGGLASALALGLAKADFIACDVADLSLPLIAGARARGCPVLTWTVRNAVDRRVANAHADQMIFEGADE